MGCFGAGPLILLAGASLLLFPAHAPGQGLLERLEQRVRQRLAEPAPAGPLPHDGAAVVAEPVSPATATAPRITLGLEAEERGANPPYRVVVNSVRIATPAARAGFQPGDVIVSVDGLPVGTVAQIADLVGGKQPGESLTAVLDRDGQRVEVVARFAGGGAPLGLPRPSPGVQPPPAPEPAASPGTNGNAPTVERPQPGSGRLGVTVENVTSTEPGAGVPVRRGAVVVEVAAESPADVIGISPGDVIVAIDGRVIQQAAGLIDQISTTEPGQTVEISFYRGRQLVRTGVRLAGPSGIIEQAPPGSGSSTTVGSAGVAPPASAPGGGVLEGLGSAFGGFFGGASASPSVPGPLAPDTLEISPAGENPGVDSTPPLADEPRATPRSRLRTLEPPSMLRVPPTERPAAEYVPLPPPSAEPTEALAPVKAPALVETADAVEAESLRAEIQMMRERLQALEQKLQELEPAVE